MQVSSRMTGEVSDSAMAGCAGSQCPSLSRYRDVTLVSTATEHSDESKLKWHRIRGQCYCNTKQSSSCENKHKGKKPKDGKEDASEAGEPKDCACASNTCTMEGEASKGQGSTLFSLPYLVIPLSYASYPVVTLPIGFDSSKVTVIIYKAEA